MRIRQASAFLVSIHGDLEDPELKPVLFAEHLVEQANESGDLLSETQQILGQQQSDFSDQFRGSTSNPSTYLLQTGSTYIDPALRESMAFREVAASTKATRKALISSPRAVSRVQEGPRGRRSNTEHNFAETSEFSDWCWAWADGPPRISLLCHGSK